MQNLLCLQFDILFFNERHMPIAINIEGKYKNITLGGYNQGKGKNRQVRVPIAINRSMTISCCQLTDNNMWHMLEWQLLI